MSLVVAIPSAQPPGETLDLVMIAKIRDEGLNRSQVMDHIGWLSDVYGPRLTGGPGIRQAAEWTLKKFAEWDLAHPHLETFPFGRGWSLVRFSARHDRAAGRTADRFSGVVDLGNQRRRHCRCRPRADRERSRLREVRGSLKGKIVLTQPARAVRMLEAPSSCA